MRFTSVEFPQDIVRAFQEMLHAVLILETNSSESFTKIGEEGTSQLNEMKKNLLALVGVFVKKVSTALPAYDKDNDRKIEFVALSFLDEKFIRTNWGLSDMWTENPMEKDAFGTRNSGTEVFERIDALSTDDLTDKYFALLYFLILSCGFAGKYDVEQDAKILKDYKKSLHIMIEKSFGLSEVASQASFQDTFVITEKVAKSFLPTQRKFNVITALSILFLLVGVQIFWSFKSLSLVAMAEQIVQMGYSF